MHHWGQSAPDLASWKRLPDQAPLEMLPDLASVQGKPDQAKGDKLPDLASVRRLILRQCMRPATRRARSAGALPNATKSRTDSAPEFSAGALLSRLSSLLTPHATPLIKHLIGTVGVELGSLVEVGMCLVEGCKPHLAG